jgi:hypothetical protein
MNYCNYLNLSCSIHVGNLYCMLWALSFHVPPSPFFRSFFSSSFLLFLIQKLRDGKLRGRLQHDVPVDLGILFGISRRIIKTVGGRAYSQRLRMRAFADANRRFQKSSWAELVELNLLSSATTQLGKKY